MAIPLLSLPAFLNRGTRHFPMTIRLRLTLWYTALLGATLILLSVAVYSALATNLWSQVKVETEEQAQKVADTIIERIQSPIVIINIHPFDIQLLLPDLEPFANDIGIQVINLQGDIIAKTDNIKGLRVPNYTSALASIRQRQTSRYYFTYGKAGERALVYSYPLLIADTPSGAVQIVRSVRDVDNTLTHVSRYLILGTSLSLILAALVGALLARRALSPIDTITTTASSITRTKDLERRLSIPNDASEVGKLAATFNEMLDRIQRLFKTQERLVADVSHELRTPLTTVQGNIELLQRIATQSAQGSAQSSLFVETLQETLREVEGETSRMSRMINDLLLLAQADSGAAQLKMAPVEMDTLLLEVYRQTKRIADLRKGANGWDIRLGSEDQALVWGDRERLRQLLLNLTENALKYTPDGGIIRLSLENKEGWIRVAVSDTGIGIPHEQQTQIFERFYRTDKARSREMGGSGLGLSIVQWIAQAHQGRVTVESVPQVGSTFTLWLPELQPQMATSAETTSQALLNREL